MKKLSMILQDPYYYFLFIGAVDTYDKNFLTLFRKLKPKVTNQFCFEGNERNITHSKT